MPTNIHPLYGPWKKCYIKGVPHETLVSPNLHASDSGVDITLNKFQFLRSWSVGHALPLYHQPELSVHGLGDPLKRRLKLKMKYNNEMNLIKKRYNRLKTSRTYRKYEKDDQYSGEVIRFTELLEKDPDPLFTGNYDWFYTGGTLEYVHMPDSSCILLPTGPLMNQLKCLPLDMNDETTFSVSQRESSTITLNSKSPIHEISSIALDQKSARAVVRQRNYLSIVVDCENEARLIQTFRSRKPFISSCIDSTDPNRIYSMNLFHQLARWDTETGCALEKQELCNILPTDRWSAIRQLKENVIMHANRKNIRLFDVRQSLNNKELYSFNLNGLTELCEQVSCIEKSKFDHLYYIGTSHMLFAIDLRYMPDSGQSGDGIGTTLQQKHLRWNHLLRHMPLMIKTLQRDNEEWLFISSAMSGDTKVIVNEQKTIENPATFELDEVFESFQLPYRPPSIVESFETAKLNQMCRNPISSIQKRMNFLNSGIALVNHLGRLWFLTQNSIGDIFYQKCIEAGTIRPDKEKTITEMNNWMLAVDEEAKQLRHCTKYSATNLRSTEHLLKVILSETDSANEVRQPIKSEKQEWQKSITQLANYKDKLASKLLTPWNMLPDFKSVSSAASEDSKLNVIVSDSEVDEFTKSHREHLVQMYSDYNRSVARINRSTVLDNTIAATEIDDPYEAMVVKAEFEW